MKPSELIAVIEKIRYKPGVRLRAAYSLTHDAVMFNVSGMFPERDKQETEIPVRMDSMADPRRFNEPKEVVGFVRGVLRGLELHELDEQLLYDGQRLFDPHKSSKE